MLFHLPPALLLPLRERQGSRSSGTEGSIFGPNLLKAFLPAESAIEAVCPRALEVNSTTTSAPP